MRSIVFSLSIEGNSPTNKTNRKKYEKIYVLSLFPSLEKGVYQFRILYFRGQF